MPSAFRANREAEAALVQRNQSINRRRPSFVIDSVKELAENNPVFIFNVGPWKHIIRRGPFCYDVRPCPAGAEYGEPIRIPGVVFEDYPDSETTMKQLQYDGYQTALDLIGVGIGIPPEQSLQRYGVLVSKTDPPSADELQAANRLLDLECNSLIAEMNIAASQGAAVAAKVFQADYHKKAAERLKKTPAECSWLQGTSTIASDRIACPFCGASMEAKYPKCPNCKEVVNQVAYKAAQVAAREVAA